MAAVSVQWTDQDLLTLLSTLNFRIEDIRPVAREDQRKGLLYASQIISQEIGNGCTVPRVERKIRQLWASYGNPHGDKNPYDLCVYGAFPKTLPGIDSVLFSTVRSCVEEKQRQSRHVEASKAPSNSDRRPQASQTRRSRRKAANKHEDSVCCSCGFTHNLLWVHCDGCATWQHAYCYYDTEDESKLPDSHLCNNCGPPDERPLHQNMRQLHLQLEKTKEKRKREQGQLLEKVQAESPGPFGLPIDQEVMWGPDDDEIQNYLDIIRSQIHSVANSLEPDLDISRADVANAKNPDTSLLVQTALGFDQQFWLRPEMVDPARHRPKRRQLLRAVLAAAMTVWIFRIPETHSTSVDSILLFHYQQEIFNKHGIPLLESLHRQAFIHMMEDTSPLQRFITCEAEKLANQCLEAVLPITTFGKSLPIPSAHEWTASSLEGPIRRDRLIQAFSFAMKLKQWLPLTRKCFEIYTPPPGSIPIKELVVKPDGASVGRSQVVKLCLMPGMIEYPSSLFIVDSSGPHALCGKQNLVKATEEQRKSGRVVSPAIVIVADKSDG